MLTNTNFRWVGILAISIIADDTAVASFIALLHAGDGQCSTIRPLCITRLPLLTTTFLFSWHPLPLVAQGLCSSSLDSKYNSCSCTNFAQAFGLIDDLGWFI